MASVNSLSTTFAALADPTRRAILSMLAEGKSTVSELSAPFEMSQPAVSRHLKVLEHAGLIERGREAQWRPRTLRPRPLKDATLWLEEFRKHWDANFDRLDAILKELNTKDRRTAKKRKRGTKS